jgi:hypothetical protein
MLEPCELEKFIQKHTPMKLVHDGQRNPGQVELPPGEVRLFTRKYRYGGFGLTFIYDLREPLADVSFQFYSPGQGKHTGQEFEMRTNIPTEVISESDKKVVSKSR